MASLTQFERLKEALKDPEVEQHKGLRTGLFRARCWEIVIDTEYEFASREGVIKVSLEDQFVVSGFFFARAADKNNIVYPTPISDAVKTAIKSCEDSGGSVNPPMLDGDVIWVFFDGGEITAQALAYWLPMDSAGTSYVSVGTSSGEIDSFSSEDEKLKHQFEENAHKFAYGSNIFKFGRKEILAADAGTPSSHLSPAALIQEIVGIYLGVHDLTVESLLHGRLYIRDSLDISTGNSAAQKLKNVRILTENLFLQADKLKIGKDGEIEDVLKGETAQTYMQSLVDWINDLKDIVNDIFIGYKAHIHPSAMGPTSPPTDQLLVVENALVSWATENPDVLWDSGIDPGDLADDTV